MIETGLRGLALWVAVSCAIACGGDDDVPAGPDAAAGAADADTSAPDADPNAPDADPTAPDASPTTADADVTAPDANPSAPDATPASADAGSTAGVTCGAMTCDPGQVCCVTITGPGMTTEECVASADDCDAVAVTCDGPEDCADGDVCCAGFGGGGGGGGATCEPGCGATQQELCHTADDCTAAMANCCDLPVGGGRVCTMLPCFGM